MCEADLPASPHAHRLLGATCFGLVIFSLTKRLVIQEPKDGGVRRNNLWKNVQFAEEHLAVSPPVPSCPLQVLP